MPRVPRPGRNKEKPQRKNAEQPTEAEMKTRMMAEIGLQVVIGFMVTAAVLYWLVSSFLGSGVTVPKSAGGVLDSVSTPANYAWSSESVRQAKLAGNDIRSDAFRSAVVAPDLNKIQVVTVGVFPQKTLYLSDGTVTGSLTDQDQADGQGWTLVNDACDKQPAVPAELLTYITPKQIKAANPEIVTDKGTIFGDRAWVIGFKPSSDILKRVFWTEFFDAVTSQTPDDRRWVLSRSERAIIDRGDITLDYAYAWVTREQPRELRQIEMRFWTDKEKTSGYRFLLKLFPGGDESPLAPSTFGPPDCNANTVGQPDAPVDSDTTLPDIGPSGPSGPTGPVGEEGTIPDTEDTTPDTEDTTLPEDEGDTGDTGITDGTGGEIPPATEPSDEP